MGTLRDENFNCYQTRKRHSINTRTVIIPEAEDYSTKKNDFYWASEWNDTFKPFNEVRLGLCRCMILTITFIHNLMEIIFLKTCNEKRGIICKENGIDFLINELLVLTIKKNFENRSHLMESLFSGFYASADIRDIKRNDVKPSHDTSGHCKKYSSSLKNSTNSPYIAPEFYCIDPPSRPNALEAKS